MNDKIEIFINHRWRLLQESSRGLQKLNRDDLRTKYKNQKWKLSESRKLHLIRFHKTDGYI